ncbi:MAG: hypothetical protein GTN39_05655 [Candidatus Aenigmarchaeota archaeon]|nr:hypothetical protein [Candidatus Aenigmarchaeota archaeon]
MKAKIFDRKFEYVWIALIITLMLSLTFDQYGYTYDQLRNLIVSDEILERWIPTFFGSNFYKHPPLLYYLISFVGLSGISLYTSGQIVVLLFAFLSIVFIYKLGNELFNQNFARVSAIILGVSPLFWIWGNRVLHETMVFFFFISSLYFLLLGIRKGKTRDWAAFGLLLGLGVLAKVVMFLIIPIAIIFAFLSPNIIRFRKRVSYVNLRLVRKAILSLFIAFLVYSPYLIYKFVNHAPSIIGIWTEHIRGDLPWSTEMVVRPLYYYIFNLHETLSITVTILFTLGLIFMAIRREKKLLLPLVWFLLVIAFFSLPAYKEPRLISALFPAAVLIGVYGMFELSKTLGKLMKVRPNKIILTISVLVVAIQVFSSLSVVANDGHWPSDWEMWEYLRGIEDDGGVIVSNYEYLGVRYFTDKHSEILAWGITEHDILDGMMESSVYYIFKNDFNVSEDHFNKIREFEECDCSLYRIRDKFMENVTFLKVYAEGEPLEGAVIRFYNQNAEIVYKVRSNRNGEAFLPLGNGYYYLQERKMCYWGKDAYIEIRDREAYECELISEFAIVPFVFNCFDRKYEVNLNYRGCFKHEFPEKRF